MFLGFLLLQVDSKFVEVLAFRYGICLKSDNFVFVHFTVIYSMCLGGKLSLIESLNLAKLLPLCPHSQATVFMVVMCFMSVYVGITEHYTNAPPS